MNRKVELSISKPFFCPNRYTRDYGGIVSQLHRVQFCDITNKKCISDYEFPEDCPLEKVEE